MRTNALFAAGLAMLAAVPGAWARDDGSQLRSPFRIDYLGYLRNGPKVAVFLAPRAGSLAWSVLDASGATVANGTTSDYVANDFASGDSFYRIDFSGFTGVGTGFRLVAAGERSEPFDVDPRNPYGPLAEKSFAYFKEHRTGETVFDKFIHNWASGRIVGPFWNDAGDKGSYPTNTAIAVWTLLNLYERHPEANTTLGGTTIYEEVKVGTALTHQLILPGQKLAVAKLHTNVPAWGPCEPHETGPCVSMNETKATYAMARSLAQLARVHLKEKQPAEAKRAFALARTAYTNARTEPPVCRDFDAFGGEGGIYPDNDPYALWRETGKHREPCHPGRDNVEDDSFAALVEVFLAAQAMGDPSAPSLAREVAAHPRFGEISEFWWYATAATGNLSLLTLRPAGVDVEPIRRNLFRYADELAAYEKVGYPGVTKDVHSQRWNTGDRDDLDQSWRWGSNRNLLNDAILLATAAEEKARNGRGREAAAYAAAAVRVLDYILGTNAMALSMVTGFGENAVERLHDCCVPNTLPGQMALGPNNWTNVGDPDMPPFGSLPGMKMMPLTGRGWAARELAIDGNAPLVWVAWWAQHRAAGLLAGSRL